VTKKQRQEERIEKIYSKLDEILEGLVDKERLFVIAYCEHLNKSQAAIDAGYSENGAGNRGTELYYRPKVRKAISLYLKELINAPEDNIKIIKNISEADMSDYMSPVTKTKRDLIERGLHELILDIREEQENDDEYMMEADLSEEETEDFIARAKNRKRQILKYQIELKKNPKAFRIVYGPEYLAREYVLDVAKIVRDKKHGKIKKVKHTKDGTEVEMYSALDAARDIARMHGSFEKDNQQKAPNVKLLNVDPLSEVEPDATDDSA
jgi:phage terminase small subunit